MNTETHDIRLAQLTKLSTLPEQLKTALSESLSPNDLRKQLQSRGSLTIDGTALVVGEIGDGITASLAVDVLRFVNGGRIVTNGNTLKIQANRIEVSSGSIDSFYPHDITPTDAAVGLPGTKGANGGDLYIVATDAVNGILKVNLSGENGGRGGRGSLRHPRRRWGAGAKRSRRFSELFERWFERSSTVVQEGKASLGLSGGDGGDGGRLYTFRKI